MLPKSLKRLHDRHYFHPVVGGEAIDTVYFLPFYLFALLMLK
jgi:hypothetical protein